MSDVRVTFTLTPGDEDVDEDDRTGLTAAAHEHLMNTLIEAGAENIEVEKA